MSYYRDIVIKTYENVGEPSNKRIRAHPVLGQGYSPTLNIACSAGMRESHPVGTFFLVNVKITDRQGTAYLYRHYSWDYEVLSPAEAKKFMKKRYGR